MLSDQRSPYVGRLACDWHRLPRGPLPGNHRPRLGHRRIIATGRDRASQGTRHREHSDFPGTGPPKGERAGGYGGSAGQHVVDQKDPRRSVTGRLERAADPPPSVQARAAGLGSRFDDAAQQPPRRTPHDAPHRPGQEFGLVVAARSAPPASERRPCDDRRRPIRRDLGRGTGQRPHHPRSHRCRRRTEASELETDQRIANGPLVEERRPGPGNGGGRTVRAIIYPVFERPPAPTAPRRGEQGDPATAGGAERPRAAAAAQALGGEQHVQDPAEHDRSVRSRSDTPPAEPTVGSVDQSIGTGTGSDREPDSSRTTTSRRRACRGTG